MFGCFNSGNTYTNKKGLFSSIECCLKKEGIYNIFVIPKLYIWGSASPTKYGTENKFSKPRIWRFNSTRMKWFYHILTTKNIGHDLRTNRTVKSWRFHQETYCRSQTHLQILGVGWLSIWERIQIHGEQQHDPKLIYHCLWNHCFSYHVCSKPLWWQWQDSAKESVYSDDGIHFFTYIFFNEIIL